MARDVFFLILLCLSFGFTEANTSLSWFDFYDAKALSGHNDETIGDITVEECARRCLVGTIAVPFGSCQSFDIDNANGNCVLSRANKDTPGADFSDSNPPSRFDYYHRKAPYGPCDFEAGLCQYTQDTADDFDWTRDSGGTPTGRTGPTVDHTTGTSSGHYMYIETTLPRQDGDIARLISPTYRAYPDGQCLLFWTHMYGGQIIKGYVGTLTVSVKADVGTTGIWTKSGNQGNQWFNVAVSITSTGSYQVIFEAVKGELAHGDIAIDDVSILQGACPADADECNGGRGPCDQACTNTVGSYFCWCNRGYRLNSDGHACDRVQCPTLTAPENGAVTGSNSYQDEVQFSCNHGYQLIGDSSRTCQLQADRKWTGADPTCIGVQCPTITAPENGAVTGGNSYQAVVQFTCNHGYQLIGDSSRTCQADGTWTGADPACIGPSDITPTSVGTAAISPTEITLTWSLPGYINLVTGYDISVRPSGSTDVTSIGAGQLASLSWPVKDLEPYTYYELWIVAKIEDFQSDRSEIVSQRTQAGVPTEPQNVKLTNLSWSELRVTWKDPENFYGPNDGYLISLYTSTPWDAVKSGIEVAQNSTEYRFSGLEAATSYTVEARASNGRNTGPPGNATARTSDGYPSSPTNINLQEEDSHCNISWSSPVVPRGDIIGYKVHLQGDYFDKNEQAQRGEYNVKSTTSTSIRLMKSTKTEIQDLLPNSVYTINVTGFTYTGEGGFSQTVNCTVPPGKPSKPDSPVRPDETKVGSTTFPLQVKPASERNGPIGCYHVVVVKSTRTDILPDPETLQPYKTLEEAKDSGDGSIAYITMALTPDAVGESTEVTVGDGTVTSCRPQQGGRKRRALTSDDVYNQEYTNSPLEPDSSYTTSVRAYGPNDGEQPYFSASQYIDPVPTAGPPSSMDKTTLIIIIATVCGGVVLLGIIAAVIVCYCRKKKATEKSALSQRTGTDNKGIEMAPVDYDTINDANNDYDTINDDNADDNNIDNQDNGVVYDVVPPAPLTDFKTPIPASRLEEVYDQRHANDNQVFREEYASIPDVRKPHVAHTQPENENKNRFKNIFTYDNSRVVLTTQEDQPGTDYINANYIDGYNNTSMFIAAQGPLPITINDFWRMIWEQDTATIVMVTNLREKNKPKCAQYWPNKDSMDYGNIRVTLEETTTLVDYVIRRFNIQEDEDPARTVTQFHFTSWPDFGVPQSPLGMMKFIRRAKTSNPPGRGPIVVHCSAGVGRSGTFIAIEAMQEMMAAEGRVDVRGFIGQMRNNRQSMVQTADQYVFIYRALLEQHLYGDTEVEVANIHRHMHKLKAPSADPNEMGYEAEFKKLTRIPVDQDNMKTANKQENKKKNRVVSIVPYDTYRVFLPKITGVSGSDYINASFIDGYRQRDGFIATQGPLPNTIDDFWRMIWHWESYSIVMLTELEENGREKSAKYWPDDGHTYGKVRVELKNTEESEGYTLRTFHVSNMGERETPRREIRQFHFHDWSATGVPRNASRVLELIGQVQKQQMKSGNGPITVHCSNGAGRTGAFIALNTVLERVKAEGICDLFQTVKSMRYSRPHMVQTAEQYLFCYKAVMEYLDSFDDYANFQ
ncbi:PTPRA [Branchiostoma lanceolatum]|uniref:protein-tyrosine-phosphatase n=1 Tax=Branchiostoma lanceolatum TaxID=7740 RepID=A0A8J9YY60_BRALA|nr:PTPRA [Branchiostoma lanceolatum]